MASSWYFAKSAMTAAEFFQRDDSGLDDLVGAGILSHEISRDPDACAFERARLQVLRVIALESLRALLRRIVGRIDAGHDPQRHRHIVDATRHRPTRIERERQWHDACAAEEPVRRLQTDNSVDRRWAADRSAGIGAQAKWRE